MARQRHKYRVYLRKTIFVEYDIESPADIHLEALAGETWAVSHAQAINNVRVRNDKKVLGHNFGGDTHSEWEYVAFRTDEDSPFKHDGWERIKCI